MSEIPPMKFQNLHRDLLDAFLRVIDVKKIFTLYLMMRTLRIVFRQICRHNKPLATDALPIRLPGC